MGLDFLVFWIFFVFGFWIFGFFLGLDFGFLDFVWVLGFPSKSNPKTHFFLGSNVNFSEPLFPNFFEPLGTSVRLISNKNSKGQYDPVPNGKVRSKISNNNNGLPEISFKKVHILSFFRVYFC